MQQPENDQSGDENADGNGRRTNADDGEVHQQRACHRADQNGHRNERSSGHEKQTATQNFDNAREVTKPLAEANVVEHSHPHGAHEFVQTCNHEYQREKDAQGPFTHLSAQTRRPVSALHMAVPPIRHEQSRDRAECGRANDRADRRAAE